LSNLIFLFKKCYFWVHSLKLKQINMTDLLNINSTKFLGGTGVHNLIKVALVGFVVYKLAK